jgi:hypothetical protein
MFSNIILNFNGLIFSLSRWNVSKILAEYARNQLLEAKTERVLKG